MKFMPDVSHKEDQALLNSEVTSKPSSPTAQKLSSV